MSAAQAIQGFGNTALDIRFPFLPVGCAVAFEVKRLHCKPYQDGGQAIYADGTVRAVAAPGGGQEPPADGAGIRAWPANANPIPATVGADYSVRIDGFGRPSTHQFACQDYKALLCALLEGVTFPKPGGLAAQDPALQDQVAVAAMTEQGRPAEMTAQLIGKVIGVQTRAVGGGPRSQTKKRKLTHVFHPPSALAGK